MIRTINYNWYATPENGEEFTTVTVGDNSYGDRTCERIEAHYPQGEGDKWYATIYYSNGATEVIFNPNQVFYENDKL